MTPANIIHSLEPDDHLFQDDDFPFHFYRVSSDAMVGRRDDRIAKEVLLQHCVIDLMPPDGYRPARY